MKSTVCKVLLIIILPFSVCSCSVPVIETNPATVYDTSQVVITGNAESGNKGLLDFAGPVFVHLGLITDSSLSPKHWRYVKFNWGSTQEDALTKPAGKDKWSYTIPNIRKFFGVSEREKIINLAVLFRAGNCIDTNCRTLRNVDRSDIFIPVIDVTRK